MGLGVSAEEHSDAHHEGGRVFVGGTFTFWNDTKQHSKMFEVTPEGGWLFNDTWGVGVMLGYGRETGYDDDIRSKTLSLKLAPFARYYFYHREPFNLYIDGGFGFNLSKTVKGNDATVDRGFEVGLRPGACLDLAKGFCLCLRVGFLGFRKNYFAGEEPEIGKDGFGLRFAPEELQIGLEFEF